MDSGLLKGSEAAWNGAVTPPQQSAALYPPVQTAQPGGWLPGGASSLQRLMQVPVALHPNVMKATSYPGCFRQEVHGSLLTHTYEARTSID